jgi:hypothetical protein
MMKQRRVGWMALSLVLLSSCGSPDKKTDDTTPAQATPEQVKKAQEEAGKIIDQQLASVQRKEAATFPCSLYSQQEIDALAGNPLQAGSYTFNHVSHNDHKFRSESCDWSAKSGEGNEVGLWVSLPKHFDSGKVECSPGNANTKISGVGDQAWWEYQKYFGMGTLRVCSAKAMLEVKVDLTTKEESAARTIAQAVAEKVLASQ